MLQLKTELERINNAGNPEKLKVANQDLEEQLQLSEKRRAESNMKISKLTLDMVQKEKDIKTIATRLVKESCVMIL